MGDMEDALRKPEAEPYRWNLRTNFDETKQAMASVERGGWLAGNERIAQRWDEASEGDRTASLEGARRWLQTADPADDYWHTVYGDGGINRWYVHADGRVRFSKFHASPDGLARAKEKGFWIE